MLLTITFGKIDFIHQHNFLWSLSYHFHTFLVFGSKVFTFFFGLRAGKSPWVTNLANTVPTEAIRSVFRGFLHCFGEKAIFLVFFYQFPPLNAPVGRRKDHC